MAKDIDVIVVGAGNAALTAALSAAEASAEVLVLEKAPESERGGNTAISSGIFRHAHNGKPDIRELVEGMSEEEWRDTEISPYGTAELYKDIMALSQGKADPVLSATWINKSYEAVLWMKKSLGIKFAFNDVFKDVFTYKGGIKEFHGPEVVKTEGEGRGLSSGLFAKCEITPNIRIRYQAKMEGLLIEAGKACGVRARISGRLLEIKAGAVVLGSGGFESSEELRARFLGSQWEKAKVRGTRHNTGETLLAAIESGADVSGEMSGCHATQIDARAPDYGNIETAYGTSRYSWPYGIMVNNEGCRFADEGEDFVPLAYEKLGKAILMQNDAMAYQIFDQKTAQLLDKEYGTMSPVTAQSIIQLGERLGVDAARLEKTVAEFNRHIDESRTFDPKAKDGRRTAGIEPPKTNWAQAIDKPPFIAYPVTCGITFTYGGLRINEMAQVIGKNGLPIQGLYATGEITGGFFYNRHPRGSGLTKGAVFGRIAGAEAASHAK